MRDDITTISIDTAVSMMAYVCARHKVDPDIVKDAFALMLSDKPENVFDIEKLYAQTMERATILRGI